jgi:hypothetical protein
VAISTAHYILAANTRVQIVGPDTQPQHVCVHNHEHSSNSEIYIGGGDVTVANGIHAQATLTSQLVLPPGEALYAISDTSGVELHIMVIKQD